MKKQHKTERLLKLAREKGILRAKDLSARHIPRAYLARLVSRGQLVKVARGLYRSPDAEITEHYSLVQACRYVPHGVVCLLSALAFHDLTTQLPHQIWMAIGNGKWRPRSQEIPLRIVRFSGSAYSEGIEEHMIEGVKARIYNPAKTVADCFKYRNKIGLDVALEALRECWRYRRCTMDQLWKYAKICRVAVIMRPYLESLV